MNAKDRYNYIVDEIEKAVREGGCTKPGDIAEQVLRKAGRSIRDLNSIFSFLIDQPLIQYIRTRQMMAAYQSLLEGEEFDIDRTIAFTGLGDQPAFNKAFRKCFGVTPGQAFKERNEKLYKPAMTWDVVSDSRAQAKSEEEPMSTKTLFGIEMGVLAKITEAMDYQAMYGFTPVQGNAAYELAEKTKCPLKECFAFVDDFCIHYFTDNNGDVAITDENEFKERILKSSALAEFCIGFDLSIEEAYTLMLEIAHVGLSPSGVAPVIIELYLNGEMDFPHFWYAYNWGLEHGVTLGKMGEFLFSASHSESLEEALNLIDYSDIESCGDVLSIAHDEEEFHFRTGHELEFQETEFSNCERFDEDYDIDNMGYDDADNLDF